MGHSSLSMAKRYLHLALGHFQGVLEYDPATDFRLIFDTSPLAEQEGKEKAL